MVWSARRDRRLLCPGADNRREPVRWLETQAPQPPARLEESDAILADWLESSEIAELRKRGTPGPVS